MLGSPCFVTCISTSMGATSRSLVKHSSRKRSGRGAQTWGNQAPNRWTKELEGGRGHPVGLPGGFTGHRKIGDKTLRVSLSHVWCRHSEQLEGWGLGDTGLWERCY